MMAKVSGVTTSETKMGQIQDAQRKERKQQEIKDYHEYKQLGKLGQRITTAVGKDNMEGWPGTQFEFGDEQSGRFRVEFGHTLKPKLVHDDYYDERGRMVKVLYPNVTIWQMHENDRNYYPRFDIMLDQDPEAARDDSLYIGPDDLANARLVAAYFDQSVIGLVKGLAEAFDQSVPIHPANTPRHVGSLALAK